MNGFRLVATAALVTFSPAAALAGPFEPGDFLVAEFDASRVAIYDANLTFKSYLVTGLAGATGLDLLPNGNVVAAGRGGPTDVRIFRPDGTLASSFDPAGGPSPIDVRAAANGNVYLSTQNATGVLEYTPAGALVGSFTTAGFDDPEGLALLPGNRLYAGEGGNDPVRIFDTATRALVGSFALDNGQAAVGSISYSPITDTLLLGDFQSGRIFERRPDGTFVRVFDAPGFDTPYGSTRLANGQVYAVDFASGLFYRFAADGTLLGTASAGGGDPVNVLQIPVPEPATLAALAGVALLALRRRRDVRSD